MRHRVAIDPRENGIACCNRHTNCPEVFELNPDDGLAQIKSEHRLDMESLDEVDVPNALEDCVRIAEDPCPVAIIHVEKQG